MPPFFLHLVSSFNSPVFVSLSSAARGSTKHPFCALFVQMPVVNRFDPELMRFALWRLIGEGATPDLIPLRQPLPLNVIDLILEYDFGSKCSICLVSLLELVS